MCLDLRRLGGRQRRQRLDPAAPVGALERLGGVEQQLVPAPGGLQLQRHRQPVGRADRDADRGDAGQVGEGAAADVGFVGGDGAARQLDHRRLQRRRHGRDGRAGDHVDLLEDPGQRLPRHRSQPPRLDRRDRRHQQSVLEQAAAEWAQLRIEVVEPLGGDAAETLAVGDQDRRQRRRGEFGQLDLPHLATGL
jgi:hypothetical protein